MIRRLLTSSSPKPSRLRVTSFYYIPLFISEINCTIKEIISDPEVPKNLCQRVRKKKKNLCQNVYALLGPISFLDNNSERISNYY